MQRLMKLPALTTGSLVSFAVDTAAASHKLRVTLETDNKQVSYLSSTNIYYNFFESATQGCHYGVSVSQVT